MTTKHLKTAKQQTSETSYTWDMYTWHIQHNEQNTGIKARVLSYEILHRSGTMR